MIKAYLSKSQANLILSALRHYSDDLKAAIHRADGPCEYMHTSQFQLGLMVQWLKHELKAIEKDQG